MSSNRRNFALSTVVRSSLLLAMVCFLEPVKVFQWATLAFEPEERSFIVAAIKARIAFLFTVTRTCHSKPEKLMSCQPICSKQQIFAAFLFPLQIVVVSKIKLVKCLLEAKRVNMKDLKKDVI